MLNLILLVETNMKTMKKLLPVAIALSAAAAPAMAEISANIGATSNYLWRGISLSNDDAAVSGGVDWASDIGLYAGTWISNLGGGQTETDFYGGFAMDIGDNMNLDVGYIQYSYLDGGGNDQGGFSDYGEVYANFSLSIFTVGAAYTAWNDDANDDFAYAEGDIYIYAAVDFDLGSDWSVGGTVGYTEFDNDGKNGNGDLDYSYGQADLTKSAGDFGDFTLTVSYADNDVTGVGGDNADNVKTVVAWSKAF
jgi:uncharacterized protein (TIGR02001 family)